MHQIGPLSEEDTEQLLREAKDVAFRFLKATENEPLPTSVETATEGFTAAYESIVMPFARKYPSYSRWIAQFVSDVREGRPIIAPVHNNYVRMNKATENQVLKVMLLQGTKEQVFSAAKEIGLVSRVYPETDESLAQLRGVIKALNDVWGS